MVKRSYVSYLSIIICGLFIIGGLKVYRYFVKGWKGYYQRTLYQEPKQIVKKAVKMVTDTSAHKALQVLDLGAGSGNETAYLLQQGWRVIAVDAEPQSINIITTRDDVKPYQHQLTLIQKKFEDLDWEQLQPIDMIVASYSLPFIHASKFHDVWQHITQLLPVGGLFVGHFFGPDDGKFNVWQKRNMTLLVKDQVLDLFKEFEILFFKEFHENDKNGVLDHSFNVIARKV